LLADPLHGGVEKEEVAVSLPLHDDVIDCYVDDIQYNTLRLAGIFEFCKYS